MTLPANELRHKIIRTTLREMGEWTLAREYLLLGTAAQESGLGQSLKKGRRSGIYHISPSTHRVIWDRYLINEPELASTVRGLASQHSFLNDPHGELITNLKYASAIAWLIYKRSGHDLPKTSTLEDLAQFWHRRFRTQASAGVEDFIANFLALGLCASAPGNAMHPERVQHTSEQPTPGPATREQAIPGQSKPTLVA